MSHWLTDKLPLLSDEMLNHLSQEIKAQASKTVTREYRKAVKRRMMVDVESTINGNTSNTKTFAESFRNAHDMAIYSLEGKELEILAMNYREKHHREDRRHMKSRNL